MAKGDICRLENCDKEVKSIRSSLCNMHKNRWFKYKSFEDRAHENNHYHYSDPRPKIPEGFVQWCDTHGYLTEEKVYLHKRGKYCKECRLKKNRDRKTIVLDPNIVERKCGCCKQIKLVNDFSPQQNTQRWPICRVCRVNYASAGRAKHKYHYKKWYNLTADQYKEILKQQNYRCYICNRTADEAQPGKKSKRENNLSVDHCHKLEKEGIMAIRGLLCFSCNVALGKFNDDINLFKKAIEYLERDPVLITKQ